MRILYSLPKSASETSERLVVYKDNVNKKTYLKVITEETDYIIEYPEGDYRLQDLITLLTLKEQKE